MVLGSGKEYVPRPWGRTRLEAGNFHTCLFAAGAGARAIGARGLHSSITLCSSTPILEFCMKFCSKKGQNLKATNLIQLPFSSQRKVEGTAQNERINEHQSLIENPGFGFPAQFSFHPHPPPPHTQATQRTADSQTEKEPVLWGRYILTTMLYSLTVELKNTSHLFSVQN